jgi:hypothetical protein
MPEKIVIGNKKDLKPFNSKEYTSFISENKGIIKEKIEEVSVLSNEKVMQTLIMLIEKIRSNPNYATFIKQTQSKVVKEEKNEDEKEEFSYLEEEAPFNRYFGCFGSREK